MDKIYPPENFMATKPLEIAKHFQEYAQVCPLAATDQDDVWKVRKDLFKEEFGLDLSEEEMVSMEEACSVDKLKAKHEIPELPLSEAPANHVMPHFYKVHRDGDLLETVKCKQQFDSMCKDLWVGLTAKVSKYADNSDSREKEKDITPGSTFLYNVTVYKPFSTMLEKRLTIENVLPMFEFEVLGINTLTQLCDSIKCVSDKFAFRPVENTQVDLDELFDPIKRTPSRCFFIENSFYVDLRHSDSTDYADVIIEWAKDQDIGEFDKKTMDVRLDELKPRLGFGYVYIHQGKCEHVITFSDARLVQSSDSLISSLYPRSLLQKLKTNYLCFICRHTQATWMVMESDRLPVSRAFFCTKCCDSYMFLNGEKLGKFKLYPHYNEASEVEKVDCIEEIFGTAPDLP